MTCARLGRSKLLWASVISAIGATMPSLALAHHPMGGETPKTLWDGLLSGIGHPMLGPDHFAFIIGIGLLVALSRRWLWLPVAFVATLLPGVLTHAAGVGLGPNELWVALSVAVLGLALLVEDRVPAPVLVGAVLVAGFCHGYAFGETIVGAETTPIVAYIGGLAVTILAIVAAVAWGARRVFGTDRPSPVLQRGLAMLLVVGGGVFVAQTILG